MMILGLAAPVAAQDADQAVEADASVPRLPADSMELGAKYMNWILDYEAEDQRDGD